MAAITIRAIRSPGAETSERGAPRGARDSDRDAQASGKGLRVARPPRLSQAPGPAAIQATQAAEPIFRRVHGRSGPVPGRAAASLTRSPPALLSPGYPFKPGLPAAKAPTPTGLGRAGARVCGGRVRQGAAISAIRRGEGSPARAEFLPSRAACTLHSARQPARMDSYWMGLEYSK